MIDHRRLDRNPDRLVLPLEPVETALVAKYASENALQLLFVKPRRIPLADFPRPQRNLRKAPLLGCSALRKPKLPPSFLNLFRKRLFHLRKANTCVRIHVVGYHK